MGFAGQYSKAFVLECVNCLKFDHSGAMPSARSDRSIDCIYTGAIRELFRQRPGNRGRLGFARMDPDSQVASQRASRERSGISNSGAQFGTDCLTPLADRSVWPL